MRIIDLDSRGFPMEAGIYLIRVFDEIDSRKIDVYECPDGNLCCFKDDIGYGGMSCGDDEIPDHIRIDRTGLEFIQRIGDLE